MLFNSLTFVIFALIVIPVYFILPQKARPVFLLAASWYFYMSWNVVYIFLFLGATLLSYFAARLIESGFYRKTVLGISVGISFGALFLFKYFGFTMSVIADAAGLFGLDLTVPDISLALPVGISFYTFQMVSYVFDVYKGKMKAQRNFITYALYLAFFVQLVAGPIERAENLIPQFFEKQKPSLHRFERGLQRMLWGYFKKMVVADRLSIFVDAVYKNPAEAGGTAGVVATVFFAFQIYCDFSGYCDIATGVADIMGFRLSKNFDRPYISQSIGEFWDRWHMTLSSWLFDYIYVPLGGSRVGKVRYVINVMTVFVASGIWHGAGWTFIVWGLVHGIMVSGQKLMKKIGIRIIPERIKKTFICKAVFVVLTFCVVTVAWIFFRAGSLSDAFTVISGIKDFSFASLKDGSLLKFGLGNIEMRFAVASVVFLYVCEAIGSKIDFHRFFRGGLKYIVFTLLVLTVMIFGVYGSNVVKQFIYFQF